MPFSDARECAIMRDILLILIKFSIAAVLFLILTGAVRGDNLYGVRASLRDFDFP